MSYDQYRWIFIIAAAAAGLALVVAVVLFFVLKIPRVIGELSGRTARKAIEGIRSQTEQSGDKERKPSGTGKLQNKPARKGGGSARSDDHMSTQKLAQEAEKNAKGRPGAPAAAPAAAAPETAILAPTLPETAQLSARASETTLLAPEANETTLLTPEENLTTIRAPEQGEAAQLNPAARPFAPPQIPQPAAIPQPVPQPAGRPVPPAFVIEYEITYIHSDEYIA